MQIFGSYTSVDVTNFELYNSIRESNQYSNVMIYGDYSVGHEPLSSFIGYQIFEDQSTRSISMKVRNLKFTYYYKACWLVVLDSKYSEKYMDFTVMPFLFLFYLLINILPEILL